MDARANVARAYHSAVLLADGNVLIVGGYSAGGGGSVEQSAELFVTSAGRFDKVVGAAQMARVQPALTVRADGIVQIVGGDQADSIEYYDPATQTFGLDPVAAAVTTDRSDYAPGETVTFVGRCWLAGETVRLVLGEEPTQHADRELFATADESGHFVNTDFAPEEHDLGVTFNVTATGLTSGRQALWVFTDGSPSVTGYVVSSSGGGSILAGGTDIGNHCDDCTTTITLPFPVTIYDQAATTATVSSNGTVQFTAPFGIAFQNGALPTATFGKAILPYWDDLRTDVGGGIFTQTAGASPNRVFHIRFNAVYYACATCVARFELLLFESLSEFDVVYGGLSANGSATIGAQRSSTGPSTWYLNAAGVGALASGTVLRFTGAPLQPTTTSLIASVNPSVFGQSATLTAIVTSNGSPVTDGSVTFAEGATVLAGPIALGPSGQASFSTGPLPAISHVITASYSCRSTWASSSAAMTQMVNRAGTTTAVSSSANPTVFGQPVTFTASINPVSPGSGMPTGTFQFQVDGADTSSPVPIVAGRASLTLSSLSRGIHTIAASYAGDAAFMSGSGSLSHIVDAADTTTALVSTVNPTVYGEAATFTVTVAAVAPGSGTPAGSVQFRDNGAALGPAVALSGGGASVTLSSLSAGTHAITAEYAGDSSFNGGTSLTVVQTVNKASATIHLSGLSRTFDGSPKAATVWTDPEGLIGVSVVYNGSPALPIDAGSHTVVASLNNANYVAADATGTLVIDRASQTIAFAPLGDKSYGDLPFTVAASASSGLDVAFAASGSCGMSGTTVTLVSGGLCTVTAEQPGNSNYYPAPGVRRQFTVAYAWSNLLPPIRVNGTSIFKIGSTVPVKFQLTGASAALTNLPALIHVSPVSNGVTGLELEAESTSAADSGNTFRYDAPSGQYIFNLATKTLAQGTWQIRIDLQDGSPHTVMVSLK
ncbi:MAG: hypothetical protein DMF89_14380 [Acidobacteria bacterium]|nr:MAG: hypothetical protein DMF89_14380 [Acidobacteriota bacterium]